MTPDLILSVAVAAVLIAGIAWLVVRDHHEHHEICSRLNRLYKATHEFKVREPNGSYRAIERDRRTHTGRRRRWRKERRQR